MYRSPVYGANLLGVRTTGDAATSGDDAATGGDAATRGEEAFMRGVALVAHAGLRG